MEFLDELEKLLTHSPGERPTEGSDAAATLVPEVVQEIREVCLQAATRLPGSIVSEPASNSEEASFFCVSLSIPTTAHPTILASGKLLFVAYSEEKEEAEPSLSVAIYAALFLGSTALATSNTELLRRWREVSGGLLVYQGSPEAQEAFRAAVGEAILASVQATRGFPGRVAASRPQVVTMWPVSEVTPPICQHCLRPSRSRVCARCHRSSSSEGSRGQPVRPDPAADARMYARRIWQGRRRT